MTVELCQSPASFHATNQAPTHKEVPIQECREHGDAEVEAFFEECQASGRPYIDYHAASGSFRYVYFNRSKSPTPKLIRRLNALGCQFDLLHYHVLGGHIPADCFGDRESIPYQGLFSRSRRELSPEKVESFIGQLSGLLPRFDRPAAIKTLVQRAIEDDYFISKGDYPFGDRELEEEAERDYFSWCQEHDHPYIIFRKDDAYVHYYHGKVLSPDAVTRMVALADRFGMKVPTGDTDEVEIYPLEKNDPRGVPHPDFWGFASKLHEILIDPRSYTGHPA